ncbi:fimbrial protein [Dryocola sp. BD626]|uniref:fimbrial protein n=1 Tax=Dryocola sp. BD626 TaxID=3133273 RepID=UPI003F50A042
MKIMKVCFILRDFQKNAMLKPHNFMTMALLLASFSSLAISNQAGDSKPFSFQGKISMAADCKVSNDGIINIPFGNVSIAKIDSGSFVRPIPYDLNCENLLSGNTVALQFIGTKSSFDSDLLGSDVHELGVRILKDGSPMALDIPFTLSDPSKPPKLEVQLVKDPTADLPESPFSATGTLVAIYY